MSASSVMELQQPLGEGEGGTTSTQQLTRAGSEATAQRTNLSAESLATQSKDNSNGDYNGGDIDRCFSYASVTMMEADQGHDPLEPPAWKPPEQEEIEYTDAWNHAYGNNQSHFLQPFAAKDDSTIGSNNSMFAFCGNSLSSQGGLRPRGFSITSNNDSIEISTQPQLHPQPNHCRNPSLPGPIKLPHPGHRRQPSLPKNIFSSQPTAHHPLLPPAIVSTRSTNQQQAGSPPRNVVNHQAKPLDQAMKLIQSSTEHTPYEVNSSHHTSQVLADAARAGLAGALIDLYAVDRSVDTATATMVAMKEDEGGHTRTTALGTLHDVQCILELYRIDKIADKFKVDLQMPLFVEEEAWVHDVYKDLRKIDVEMEIHSRKIDAKEANADDSVVRTQNEVEQREDFHFDLSDSDDEGLGGEDIIMKADSFLTEDDHYRFFDPHETSALLSNKHHATEVCASIHDDLRDVIELLKTDAEIDGASKRNIEMDMIRPLLEVDQEVQKWKESSAMQELWSDELKALYAVDVEVDRAKTRDSSKQKAKSDIPDIISTASEANSSQDVKDALARHIPNVSLPFCPTSPEPININAKVSSIPPPTLLIPDDPDPAPAKRSIFTQREKNSAVNAQRGATMMPGTTTVVIKGGEMIDDIPVGKVKFPNE